MYSTVGRVLKRPRLEKPLAACEIDDGARKYASSTDERHCGRGGFLWLCFGGKEQQRSATAKAIRRPSPPRGASPMFRPKKKS